MRKQDQLGSLISGLNRTEKRYFKLHSPTGADNKNFMRLFDELAKGKPYEPGELSKKLNISKKLLAHSKNYLEKVLLDSLRLYSQNNDIKIWLGAQLQAVRILFVRRQYELALAINERALKKALAYDNFKFAWEFLGYKHDLLVLHDRLEEGKKAQKLVTLSMDQLIEESMLMEINTSFSEVAGGGKDKGGLLRKVVQKRIFKTSPEKLKSDTARILWHEMKQYYQYYVKHDLPGAISHNLAKLRIFELRPQLVDNRTFSYLGTMIYLSSHYGELGKYDEALKYCTKLEYETSGHRKDISEHVCARFNLIARAMRLYLLNYIGKYYESAKIGRQVDKDMNRLETGHFIITRYHYALALFYTGKYDHAQKICEELLNPLPDVSMVEQFCARLLLIMIHYAFKNYSLLPHLASSATSWARRHKITAPGTTQLSWWFRKFAKAAGTTNEEAFFRQFEKALNKNTFKDYPRELGLKQWVRVNSE